MGETNIQWTDFTWNPVRGCSRISPGCEHCYAETMAARFSAPGAWAHGFALQGPARWTRKVALVPSALDLPLRWKKPRRIFVNSMSDLFHESLSNEEIAAVFGVMAACPQHTFQILTKRAERMARWFKWLASVPDFDLFVRRAAARAIPTERGKERWRTGICRGETSGGNQDSFWPLRNVWLGVSVEDQARADERIPHLLATPAAVRFLSVEPLLGPIDLKLGWRNDLARWDSTGRELPLHKIDWVIVGGESGHGARPMRLEWARSIVEQCKAAGVACFVKQLGARPEHDLLDGNGLLAQVRPLHLNSTKGGDMAEWPEDLRVREFPWSAP